MGLFERYLSLWVTLCILAGVFLGNLAAGLFALIAVTNRHQHGFDRPAH